MGRLKYLEVENFKSYQGKHFIGPFDDFTCVIGPNGSGKSNLMDAISFVLGVQSRHLRSAHLKELLYRRDANSPPARSAKVMLVYEVSEGEVEDVDAGEELHFSRSISSTGVSTYRINNKEISYEAYETILSQIGVLVKARNFLVFQGDIESIASKSPSELTAYFEYISNSESYKAQYTTLAASKATMEESILFSMQKKKMYLSQKKEVKVQKDEAEHYEEAKSTLEEAKVEHCLWQLLQASTSIAESQELRDQLTAQRDELQAHEDEYNEALQDIKKQMVKATKSHSTVEKEATKAEKELLALKPNILLCVENIKTLEKRQAQYKKSMALITKDIDAQKDMVEGLHRDIGLIVKQEQTVAAQLSSFQTQHFLSESNLAEYVQLRSAVAAEVSVQKTQHSHLSSEIAQWKHQQEELNRQESVLRSEMAETDGLIAEYRDKLDKIEASVKEKSSEQTKLQAKKDSINNAVVAAQQTLRTLESDLVGVNNKLLEISMNRQYNKKELLLNETIATMQHIMPGIFGKLSDLISPIQKKYSTALSVAIGKYANAIIVDTKHTANMCIQYLKDQKISSYLFLPLDNIVVKPLHERFRQYASLVYDIASAEDKFKPVLLYAVGSTLLCNSLDEAMQVSSTAPEQLKIVTLGGHVINKNGSMTGGFYEASSTFNDKQLKQITEQKADIEKGILQAKQVLLQQHDLSSLENELKNIGIDLAYHRNNKTVYTAKLDQYKQQQATRSNQLKEFAKQQKELMKSLVAKQQELQHLNDYILNIENQRFADFSSRVGISNIRQYEETVLSQQQELLAKQKMLAEQKLTLESQLKYEQQRDFAASLKRVQENDASSKAELVQVTRQLDALYAQQTALEKQVSAAAAKRSEASSNKEQFEKQCKEIIVARNKITREMDILAKKIANEEIAIEKLRNDVHEMLQIAQVEQIALPLLRAQAEPATNGSAPTNGSTTGSIHFSESSNTVVQRDAKNLENVDLSSLSRHPQHRQKQFQAARIAELATKISDMTLELSKLQPNMHAIAQYETVSKQLDECNAELDAIREEAKAVAAQYEACRRSRIDTFKECFEHVSRALTVVYKDLTRSSGNAYLTLDNTEEPYLGGVRYTAMPPSKRFRDMEQLSGGEKTVAALALLFSIHSYRQAPFFVLDEVDAALDNINVCHYIQQQSRHFQCVVISLKDLFFEKADCLLGVCKDIQSLSSRVLSLDLKPYAESKEDASPAGKGTPSSIGQASPYAMAEEQG